MKSGGHYTGNPFERTIFTDEQDMAILKDDAIFSESLNFRRNAVDELAKRYKQRAIPVVHEIISVSGTLTGHDNEVFVRYCQLLIEELESPSSSLPKSRRGARRHA